ncbi:PspA/IM30 family protein [Longimicrobium sp.]|uniref:PspA/IM30 family protein n=1 Tax=Longimicrobium sp. TaxID=2029185 RepID=UPI002BD5B8B4|nr:PspA/IM30 family protein [Longimicrobium sp.]HSU17443.1 PspA/IM30 family protein [Longimicrobium sp.]
MGIFDRFSTMFRSNINDLIARAENPEKMLNQVIEDMRGQLAKARQEVAVAIADAAKLKKQADDEQKQAQDWEQRAMLAVRQGRDDLARQALIRHQEHAVRAQELFGTWQRHQEDTDRLRDALRQLNEKIQEAQRKKNLLIAKQRRAQAQRRIHETMSGLSDSSAFEAFDRMAERIEQNERMALAAASVSEELHGDQLERDFKQLEKGDGTDVDYRLLEMKQKMGMLPAAAPAEQRALGAGEQAPAEPAPAAAASAPAPPAAGNGAPATQQPIAQPAGGPPIHEAELLEEFEALEEEERGRA